MLRIVKWPNGPAQVRRAERVRLQTKVESRRRLKHARWGSPLSFVKPAAGRTYKPALACQGEEQEAAAEKDYPVQDTALLRGSVLAVLAIWTKLIHAKAQRKNSLAPGQRCPECE
jgi:hypothetical protein